METANPEDSELYRAILDAAKEQIFTQIPGIIERFDKASGTVVVQPAISYPVRRLNGEIIQRRYPKITSARVQFPEGGGYQVRWPINPGDECWIQFSMRDMQIFYATGREAKPMLFRAHDFSSAVIFPCKVSKKSENVASLVDAVQVIGPNGLVVGDATAVPVALDQKVMQLLSELKAAVESAATVEAGAGGMGGMTALKSALITWPSSNTAASNLKAKP